MRFKKFMNKLYENFKLSLLYDISVTVIDIIKKYKQQISLSVVTMFVISFALSPIWNTLFNTNAETPPIINDKNLSEPVFVTVVGEVLNPGMYELTDEDRVQDAIEKAGGFTGKAYVNNINLAQKLTDEQYINVPSVDDINNETSSSYNNSNNKKSFNGIININTATVSELCKLPGIGETIAKEIVRYRELTGGYKTIEDIQNVKGIGTSKYNNIKNNITV